MRQNISFKNKRRLPKKSYSTKKLFANAFCNFQFSQNLMLGIIFGCYNCYYIITGGCISIRMVLLTVRPKYRSENNLSILGGCCSDCAG